MTRLRTIGLVTLFDFSEAVRARRVVVLLLLYVMGAGIGAALFVRAIEAAEAAVTERLGGASPATGSLTEALLASEEFQRIVTGLVGDKEIARAVSATPPLALFYGWMSMFFIPLLAVLFSCDCISSEVSSGSVRFVLLRADRLSWTIGKLFSQAALMSVGLFASAGAVWGLGFSSMRGFDPVAHAGALLDLALRACFLGWPYVCVGVAASQLTRSVNRSRALALVALVGLGVIGRLAAADFVRELAPELTSSLHRLFPGAYTSPLWRPGLWHRLPAMGALILIGWAYFGLGYTRFARRDA